MGAGSYRGKKQQQQKKKQRKYNKNKVDIARTQHKIDFMENTVKDSCGTYTQWSITQP